MRTATDATGRVTLKERNRTIGSTALRGGVAGLNVRRRYLEVGTHSVTAIYAGSRRYSRTQSNPLKVAVAPRMQALTHRRLPQNVVVPTGARFAELRATSSTGEADHASDARQPSTGTDATRVIGEITVSAGQVLRVTVGAGDGDRRATTVALGDCDRCAHALVLRAAAPGAGSGAGSRTSPRLRCSTVTTARASDPNGHVLMIWLRSQTGPRRDRRC